MRIVGGEWGGLRISAPKNTHTRPSSDRLRESLFNVWEHRWGGCSGDYVMDAFAGSGALGIEALSRGAKKVIFFESDPEAVKCIQSNLESLKADSRLYAIVSKPQIHRWPELLSSHLGSAKLRWILADPPYEKSWLQRFLNDCVASLETSLAPDAKLWMEMSAREKAPAWPLGWLEVDHREAGDAQTYWLAKQNSQTSV